MLRNTARSITSVAYAAGFASGANLADHCRRRLGRTPGAIRRGLV
jgi:transcriptional regulator GlxA family with amidase domain